MHSRASVVVLFYSERGGIVHYATSLGSAIGQYCHSTVHMIGHDDGLAVESLWALLDRLRLIRQLRRLYNPNRFRRIARLVVKKHNPSVVHLATGVPCMHAFVTELQRHGVMVVYTLHDPLPHHENRTTWGKIHTYITEHRLSRRNLALVDLIHVHSEAHAAIMLRRFPELRAERIYVVQHGGGITADVAAGSEVPAELAVNSDAKDYVLFFGRIQPYKGLHVLFAAISALLPKYPELRLVVAGSGRMPPVPEDIAANLVIINRFIDDREIKAIFNKASFIVLPYLEATQTGVIPLASAFSLPAVVTRVGVVPELVKDDVTGLIVDAGDVHALAAAMERMIGSPTQTQLMGAAARSYMLEHYQWSVVAEAHFRQYMSRQACPKAT